MRSVRPTPAECARHLPGDELIDDAIGALTHAITIPGPPAHVWPWLVQMGAGRAGWYSYDWLDNGRTPSAWTIKPELQRPAIGAVFPALPGVRDGFTLLKQEPNRLLTLGWLGPQGRPTVTWSFVLDPVGDAATRLIVRARAGEAYRAGGWRERARFALIRPMHFIMERKQLVGLARRVERQSGRDALLDRFMPSFDIIEQHEIHVDAPPDVTFEAACRVDMRESRLIRAIFRGRELMMRSRTANSPGPRGLLAGMQAIGWGRLAELPRREVVMGAVTKAWEAEPTFRALAPDAFAAFQEPGWVKIAWTLRADPDGAGSMARSETRAVATDPVARARFRRYWRRVRPGVVLIRRVLMRLVKRDAERQYQSQ